MVDVLLVEDGETGEHKIRIVNLHQYALKSSGQPRPAMPLYRSHFHGEQHLRTPFFTRNTPRSGKTYTLPETN